VIVLYAGALWIWHRGQGGWLPRIALLVVLQVALGIGTLVMHVPLSLALGHQALAFMLAGTVTAWLADMRPKSLA
jgi:cytochrome c oxidase assembly protein subunit 15